MHISIFNLCGLVFLVFCVGYLCHRYGAERESDQDQDRKSSKLFRAINTWLKRWGS